MRRWSFIAACLLVVPAAAAAAPPKARRAGKARVVAPPPPPPPAPAPEPPPPPPPAPPAVAALPPPAPPAARDRVVAELPPAPRRRFTVSLNPLPIIAGRYGLNGELVAARHHAIVASAFVQTFSPAMLRVLMPRDVDTTQGAGALPGGELGYRFYTGTEGANGLFAGVSGVAMPLASPRVKEDFGTEVVSFHAYGGAVDLGVQAITSGGFTFGGGVGVMYLAYSVPASVTPPPGVTIPELPQPHVLPRLLLAAGWSF